MWSQKCGGGNGRRSRKCKVGNKVQKSEDSWKGTSEEKVERESWKGKLKRKAGNSWKWEGSRK